MDTFSAVTIQAYKLKSMNWCIFFLFYLEKRKDRMFWKSGFFFLNLGDFSERVK